VELDGLDLTMLSCVQLDSLVHKEFSRVELGCLVYTE